MLKNQSPLFDKRASNADIIWLGLSAVDSRNGEIETPLSADTPTGQLISEIEADCKGHCEFYKTNIVKCLPLRDKKIRYPKYSEMENCFSNFQIELQTHQPKLVVLLGKLVIDFIFKKYDLEKVELNASFSYKVIEKSGIRFLAVHHPSYILVYKRKQAKRYVKKIQKIILSEAA